MQKKANKIFFMSKQKNEALVHLVPFELSLAFIVFVKRIADLSPKTMKQACNAETTEQQQEAHINWSTQTFLAVEEKA